MGGYYAGLVEFDATKDPHYTREDFIQSVDFYTSGGDRYSGVRPLPRIGETILTHKQEFQKFNKKKGYPISNCEYKVTGIIHNYFKYETYVVVRLIEEKKSWYMPK